jgi:cbb3-type cytochrome c oxidase subunit III
MVGLLAVWAMMSAIAGAAGTPGSAAREFASAVRAPADLSHGEMLFDDTCITCHGADGGGRHPGNVPIVARQHWRVIIQNLVNFRHARRQNPSMQRFTDRHRLVDAQDIADVAAYISSLPAIQTPDVGDAREVSHGESVYVQRCAACHGDNAAGDNARGVPRLAGQHYAYLLKQMDDTIAGRRPDASDTHLPLLQRLEPADRSGVAAYLSRISVQAPLPADDGQPLRGR